MSGGTNGRRRFIDRLGFRLGLVLSMALLPIGLLAVLQARSLMNEAQARSEAALAGETLQVLLPELRLIRQGQGAAEVLAATVPMMLSATPGDATGCDSAMARTVAVSVIYAYAAYVTVDGVVTCASDHRAGVPVRLPHATEELLPSGSAALVPANEAADGTPGGIAAVHAVTGDNNTRLGYIVVSMPHSKLSAAAVELAPRRNDFALVIFDAEGRILSASRDSGHPTELLPGDRSLVSLTDGPSRTFTAPDTSGIERSFSVIKLADVNIFALGSSPASPSPRSIVGSVPVIVFPLMMWAACLIAAWFAAEHLVTIHIRRLRRAITHFAGGNREVVKLDMSGAPLEINEVSKAFARMTETILHDEAELENSLHQKEVLLREVHHRVKNNLQLIASIMSLQMRKAQSTEAKSLMKSLQDRVMSLATVHKGLYETSGMADIRVDELFPEIVNQVVRMVSGTDRQFSVESHFDDFHLTPDQAVPLSLLLTEAMTNAMKCAPPGAAGAETKLAISLARTTGNEVQLVVESYCTGAELAAQEGMSESAALGTQLIEAFARQLKGTLDCEPQDGTYHLSLTFPLHAPAEGEARRRGGDRPGALH